MTTPEQLGIGVVAERRLRHFMARTFQSGSYARFDGVPIPRIHPAWSDPQTWSLAGLATFCVAREKRNAVGYPLVVAVSFSLSSRPRRRPDRAPQSVEELTADRGDDPPSLSLYAGDAPFLEGGPVRDADPLGLGLPLGDDIGVELVAWQPEDDEPVRSLLVTSYP